MIRTRRTVSSRPWATSSGFERVADATMPAGVTPSLSPLFSPSGLIYRYVLQSPDHTPQELKIIDDWVLNRRYRAIQGVAMVRRPPDPRH